MTESILGWRKLTAWFLVFMFAVMSTYLNKPISQVAADLVQWVTLFFFGANAMKALFEKVPVAEALKKAQDKVKT